MRRRVIAVIGAGSCDGATAALAGAVGEGLARAGCVLVTGGLDGVMAAASQGAHAAGGLVVGILPTGSPQDANQWVDVAIATAVGDARNAIIANTAEAFVALPGEHGTLSEIAFALKRDKRVVSLGGWDFDPRILAARDAAHAVELVLDGT